jgi:hypothetical protein
MTTLEPHQVHINPTYEQAVPSMALDPGEYQSVQLANQELADEIRRRLRKGLKVEFEIDIRWGLKPYARGNSEHIVVINLGVLTLE